MHGPAQPASIASSSGLESYQPFAEGKVLPWRQANDAVGRIGGWRAYAREAQNAGPQHDPAPRREAEPGVTGHGKH